MLKIISALLLVSLGLSAEPFDEKRGSAYTYQEVLDIFDPILDPAVKIDFTKYTAVFFHDKFGKSPHGNDGLIDCWNCYYSSMKAHFESLTAHHLQIREIYSRMTSHASRVKSVAPDVYKDLKTLEAEMLIKYPNDFNEGLLSRLPDDSKEDIMASLPITDIIAPAYNLWSVWDYVKNALFWFSH